MWQNYRLMWGLILAASGLLGCPPERPDGSRTAIAAEEFSEGGVQALALVNGEALTRGEFERRIDTLPTAAKSRLTSEEARKEFLEAQVQFEILADIAEEQGYGSRPEILHVMKEAMVRSMLREELRSRVKPSDVTADELKRAYNERKYEFQTPERRRVAAVVSEFEDVSRKIHADLEKNEATDLETRINTFRLAAERHGVVPAIANQGGDIGWLDDPEHPANANTGRNRQIAEALFDLEVGEYTEPVEFDGMWYIAMTLERRPQRARTLSDVEHDLRSSLYEARRRKARQELLDAWVDDARIEIDEDVLAQIEKPEPRTLDTMPHFLDLSRLPVRNLDTTPQDTAGETP